MAHGLSRPLIADMPPIYLDCAATTPLDPRVRAEVVLCLDEDFGNAGSRTHEYGQRARAAVERARDRVAAAAGASRGDVVFTSGATEANNLAILGLAAGAGERQRHVVSTAIEHHAVLEPLAMLERRGFEIDRIAPDAGGRVRAEDVLAAVRADTLLVSVMHVNNETGVVQPAEEIADGLERVGASAFLHVDAAQGFGRELTGLRHRRIDLVSLSGHKLCGPKGVGAREWAPLHIARPIFTPAPCDDGACQSRLRRRPPRNAAPRPIRTAAPIRCSMSTWRSWSRASGRTRPRPT
jgi:cysteine desulfurase